MTLQLYTAAISPFAHRVRLVVAHKALDCEEIEVAIGPTPDWYRAMSPHGKVPLLCHHDRMIGESAVISEYLDESFPVSPLMPANPIDRAKVRYLARWCDQVLSPAHFRFLITADAAERDGHKAALETAFSTWEEHLVGPFLLGARPSLGDMNVFPFFERMAALEIYRGYRLPARFEQIAAWLAAMATLPCVAATSQTRAFYEDSYRRYVSP